MNEIGELQPMHRRFGLETLEGGLLVYTYVIACDDHYICDLKRVMSVYHRGFDSS